MIAILELTESNEILFVLGYDSYSSLYCSDYTFKSVIFLSKIH